MGGQLGEGGLGADREVGEGEGVGGGLVGGGAGGLELGEGVV